MAGMGPLAGVEIDGRDITDVLTRGAKGHAFLAGRSYVVPEDVKSIGMDVLRHRVSLTFEAEAEERTAESLLQQIFDRIKVP